MKKMIVLSLQKNYDQIMQMTTNTLFLKKLWLKLFCAAFVK